MKSNECIKGIAVSGHAGYGDAGSDIVCAAISTLIQLLHVGLHDVMRFSEQTVSVERNDDLGVMKINWPEESGIGDSVLVQTVLRSFWGIRNAYTDCIDIEEVFCNETF